jgi:hypothetical protein
MSTICFVCKKSEGVYQTGISLDGKPLLRCPECFKPLEMAEFTVPPLEHKKDEQNIRD